MTLPERGWAIVQWARDALSPDSLPDVTCERSPNVRILVSEKDWRAVRSAMVEPFIPTEDDQRYLYLFSVPVVVADGPSPRFG